MTLLQGFLILWFLKASSVFAYIKVKEDGGSQLTQIVKKIEQQEQKNLQHDQERFKQLKNGLDKLMVARRETADLMNKFQKIKNHESLLDNGKGAMDFNNKESNELSTHGLPEEGTVYDDYIMKTIDFAQEFVDNSGKIKVAVWDSPKWEAIESQEAFLSRRTQKLLVKVAAKKRNKLSQKMSSERLGNMVFDIARTLLPEKLMKNFDGERMVAYLCAKAGIVELADGIFSRPTVPQDYAFVRYSNLGCNETNEILFWSDTIVADGYYPTFGTALNKTILGGAKQVDMDDIVSRGYSRAIDQWNRTQPSEDRVKNPFRGYAARVMPGLLVMSQEGRLASGKAPDNAELTEAMKLTKTLRLLPSQNMNFKKASFSKSHFRFSYPPRIMLIQADASSSADSGSSTNTVGLDKLEEDVFKNRMEMIKTRLMDIAKLKRENRLARKYVDEIIQSNVQMQQEAQALWDKVSDKKVGNPAHSNDPAWAIPQLTQLRKDIEASIENYREYLSDLNVEFDKLLQKEWVVLEHALDLKKETIRKLMNNASVRYRTVLNPADEDSTEDTAGGET